MLILVCSKDYQQAVYYLQFIYTYMTMTTTMKKFVDQFSRITNSSYDDTLSEPLVSVCTTISIQRSKLQRHAVTMVTAQNFVHQTI